jgi:hypothetical protein
MSGGSNIAIPSMRSMMIIQVTGLRSMTIKELTGHVVHGGARSAKNIMRTQAITN